MINTKYRGDSLLQFVTWNTKGMNDAVKKEVADQKLRADVAFIEVYHFTSI